MESSANDSSEPESPFVEVPTIPAMPIDIRPVLAVSLALWVASLATLVYAPQDGNRWWSALHELAGATAGLAFGVLGGTLVFDRLRRSAEQRALTQQRELNHLVARSRRRIWVAEYELVYGALVDNIRDLAGDLTSTVVHVGWLSPLRRALEERRYSGSYLESELGSERLLLMVSDVTISAEKAALLVARMSSVHSELERYARQSPAEPWEIVPDEALLGSYLAGWASAAPRIRQSAADVWQRTSELAQLHVGLQDGRIATPDASVGPPLYYAASVRDAADRLMRVRPPGKDEVLWLSGLANDSSSAARVSQRLLEQLVNLTFYVADLGRYVEVLGSRDLEDSEAGALLRQIRANTEVALRSLNSFTTPTEDLPGQESVVGRTRGKLFMPPTEDELSVLADLPSS